MIISMQITYNTLLDVGEEGLRGPVGMTGIDGPQVNLIFLFTYLILFKLQGPRGKKGLNGLRGVDGLRGAPGPIGLIGDSGKSGEKGVCPTYCATDGGVFFVEPPAEWFNNN